jgi:outer membrane receptor protein involved in Fe transport
MANRNVARAVRLALVAAASAAAGMQGTTVYAQDTELEEVVVTGTRVQSPGVESTSPITSVGAAEIAFQQPVAVEEIIKQLPGAVPAIGPGTNNGSGGGATIDLRGLGPQRSLVLIDSKRFVPFDLNAQVDTNSVPIALVERIDLVTGGASAVYGADAVAGVVNFILKRNFEGVDVSGSFGTSGRGDANRYRADLTMGTNVADGRGNVVLSVGYTETEALLQGDRDIGAVSLSSVTGLPQGSQTGVPMLIQASGSLVTIPGTGTTGSGFWVIDPPTGALRAANPTTDYYNFNPVNYFATPLERYQATALGHYTVNEHFEPYAQIFYTRSDVDTQLASSGTFLNNYFVPIGNPFIPEPTRQQLCAAFAIPTAGCVAGANGTTEVRMALGRRITEFGPRLNSFENKTFQYNVGVRGNIVGEWDYDAYYSHGESDQTQTRVNWGSLSKVQQSLRALSTTRCTNTANGCVPINLWGPEGSITPAMTRFVNLDALLTTAVEQDVANGSVTGNLGAFKSPFAESPIGLAFGAEYRKMSARNKSDSASQIQGEVLGTGAPLPDRSGDYTLEELFAEGIIPILSDLPFASELSLEVGYRHTWFETSTGQDTDYDSYKYGLAWAPIDGLRFRGMFQRATRAPNINELYQPQVTGLTNLATDPCQGTRINQAQANTPGTLSNLCRETGVPLSNIGSLPSPSAGQINQLTGGNPDLQPEVADTITAGVVWQPSFASGLQVTLDYYDIEVTDAISAPTAADILEGCYDPAKNPTFAFNSLCTNVLRNTVNGTLNGVESQGVVRAQSNLGEILTDGWDLGVSYRFDLADLGTDPKWGSLSLGFNGNWVQNWTFQANPAAIVRDCLGFYSVSCTPTPEFVFNQRTTWSVGAFDFGYLWRHIDSLIEEPAPGNTQVFLPAFSEIDAYDYLDLYAAWEVNDNLRINVTITNVTGEDPPLVGNTIGSTSQNSGNTFPQSYDVIGTFYTVGATIKF